MNKITIDASVTHKNLVDLIEMGGIGDLDAYLIWCLQPSGYIARARVFELSGWVFCQIIDNQEVWRWSSGRWTDGTEDLKEAKYALTGVGGEDGDDSDELN